jgi:hypothetical protein
MVAKRSSIQKRRSCVGYRDNWNGWEKKVYQLLAIVIRPIFVVLIMLLAVGLGVAKGSSIQRRRTSAECRDCISNGYKKGFFWKYSSSR